MKNLVRKATPLLVSLLAISTLRADSVTEDLSNPQATPKFRNPATELRNQDSAFALLMESYRQIQTRLIQNDYEARLEAAKHLEGLKARRQVMVLAKQERDLRLEKLNGQLTNMNSGYTHARYVDEREAGVTVPISVDTAAAARQLKNYVVITPDSVERVNDTHAPTLPASHFMLSKLPRD